MKRTLVLTNRCNEPVWPAVVGNGYDQAADAIDGAFWAPLPSGGSRATTFEVPDAPGVLDVRLWGRTGCAFDAAGDGTCATGSCGGFVCSRSTLPTDATVVELGLRGTRWYPAGYNVGLRAVLTMRVPNEEAEPSCRPFECSVDLESTCNEWLDTLVRDGCGGAQACRGTSNQALRSTGFIAACGTSSRCDPSAVEITFCP